MHKCTHSSKCQHKKAAGAFCSLCIFFQSHIFNPSPTNHSWTELEWAQDRKGNYAQSRAASDDSCNFPLLAEILLCGRAAPCSGTEEPGNWAQGSSCSSTSALCRVCSALTPVILCKGFQVLFHLQLCDLQLKKDLQD